MDGWRSAGDVSKDRATTGHRQRRVQGPGAMGERAGGGKVRAGAGAGELSRVGDWRATGSRPGWGVGLLF
ncbi:hypothetical protein Afil01_41920 [Actinorhabdospora filicis]|uniref:Uncharacterized protein n=1 Tax=Actinorhabdospora filicis TaxID=1785913 RepID=A0A9W6WC44_9ACTN|nr:hypothetical protein Afil01_41920 [Actinorhabdospora filicis]